MKKQIEDIRWVNDYVYEYVQVGPIICGPGNRMNRIRVEKPRLEIKVNGKWESVDVKKGTEVE